MKNINKLGMFLFIALALAFQVSALEFDNVFIQPSLSNTTYQINVTQNLTNVSVNETHLGVNERYTSFEAGVDMNTTIIDLGYVDDPAFGILYDMNFLFEGTFNVDVSTDWIRPTALFINNVLEFSPLSISGTTELNVTEHPDNILELFVYDQATEALITQNVSLELQTDEDSLLYTIENGSDIIRNISTSLEYRLIFNSAGYEQKIYQFDGTISYYNNLTVYLLNSSTPTAETVVFGITDESDDYLQGVTIGIESIVGGVYVPIDNLITDVTGFATGILDINRRHRVTLSKDGFETQIFFLDEPLDTSYNFRLKDLINIVYETEYEGVSYSYEPSDAKIYNTTYNLSWTVSSDEEIARFRFVSTVFNSSGSQVDQIVNDSFADGGTLTSELDLSNYAGGKVETYYCFKKSGFNEACLFITKNIEVNLDNKNFLYMRAYIAENVGAGERLAYWITSTIITGLILVIIPFMRGVFMIIPLGIFSLFFAWLFLPVSLLSVVGFFVFIGVFYVFGRGGF